jgi:hypothetical protein
MRSFFALRPRREPHDGAQNFRGKEVRFGAD